MNPVGKIVHILLYALLAAFPFIGTSCIYENEDCPDRLGVYIENDWREARDASPEGMAYIFFPHDGTPFWRFDFPGTVAGKVMLPPAGYSFVSYNDDTSRLLFSDDKGYAGYEVYTPKATLPVDDGQQPAVYAPDMLWGCAYGCVNVSYDGIHYNTSGTVNHAGAGEFSSRFILKARQRPLTARYAVRINDVKNLSSAVAMSASISGMAGSLLLCSGEKGRYPSTLAFGAAPSAEDAIGGEFSTFGIPDELSVGNTLSLYVMLKDGRKFRYKFDVTDQVRNAADPMNVTLTVGGISLEESEEDNTGFEVKVDGWITIVVNIRS